MKSILLMMFGALLTLTCFNANAKDAVTKTSFIVSGNCDMCKSRIEKAAKTEGVKAAEWSEETHLLTVVFAPAKTSVDLIQQSIAKAGYDTEKYKAAEADYLNLPQCCQYERGK